MNIMAKICARNICAKTCTHIIKTATSKYVNGASTSVLNNHQHKHKRLFIYLFGVLHRFQHCTGHITALGFCTVNCRPTASNYQLSHLRPCWESNPGLRGGRQECYHSATVAPSKMFFYKKVQNNNI